MKRYITFIVIDENELVVGTDETKSNIHNIDFKSTTSYDFEQIEEDVFKKILPNKTYNIWLEYHMKSKILRRIINGSRL